MGKKKYTYLIVDTETATLPFANEIAHNEEEKKRIAIARPLIYDIGWVITDREGNISERQQFLVAETFAVPSVFNTAYYREKRPIYLEMLDQGEIEIKPWREIMKIFVRDMDTVTFCAAYNSMFDFKKAIPFTELYISKLYSADYNQWEESQRKLCYHIAEKKKKSDEKSAGFDKELFHFRKKSYKMLDLWGLSCQRLINTQRYKKLCLENGMVSPSGDFFKTSAESTFRYLEDKWGFAEAHTALEDAQIEQQILIKILSQKGKALTEGIIYFPFRELGCVTDFLMNTPRLKLKHFMPALNAMELRLEQDEKECRRTAYTAQLEMKYWNLLHYLKKSGLGERTE